MDPRAQIPEVRDYLLELLNNPSTPQFLRAEIGAWLNQGVAPTSSTAINLIDIALQTAGQPRLGISPTGVPQGGAPPGTDIPTATGADQAIQQQQQAATQPAGGGAVPADPTQTAASNTTPTVPGSTSPTGFDPTSAVGNIPLYGRAQSGDDNALALLMVETLQNLGIDPFSGTEAVEAISSTLEPYLRLVMQYSGIGDVAADKGRQYAANFQNMISTPGTFGQLRAFGDQIGGQIGGLLGDMKDPQREDLVNDLIGLKTAGGNVIENTAIQNRRKKDLVQYRLAQSRDPRISNYLNWLGEDPQRRSNPAYAGIAALLGR